MEFRGECCLLMTLAIIAWCCTEFRGECCLLMTLAIIAWCCTLTGAEEVKPTITSIDSHAGLYFDEMGQVFFYPTEWKVVSYVNLKPTQMLWRQVKAQQSQI